MNAAPHRGIAGRLVAWAGAELAWIMAVTVIAASVGVYFATFVDLWPRWVDTDGTTYTHGVLIAAISLWLIYRVCRDLRDVRPVARYWAIVPGLALSAAWLVAMRGGIVDAYTALWPMLAWTFVLAAGGWRVALALLVPIGYLYFAIPVWDYINWVLQDLTVVAVGVMNRLAGVPALVQGSSVILPQGRFEIAAGCSGLHYFMVAGAIAVLAGELHRDRLRTRALLLGLALALALVSNWLRVWIIILAGYLTDMQHYLVKVDHYKFGWVVFAVAMLVFFIVLQKLPAPTARAGQGPNERTEEPAATGHAAYVKGWLVALAATVALPVLTTASHALAGSPKVTAYAPQAVPGFTGPVSGSPAWEPHFAGADSEWRVAYLSSSGRVLDYYGNAYLRQRQGRELISGGNSLTGRNARWNETPRTAYIETARGSVTVVEAEMVVGGGQRWFTIYVYDVHGAFVAEGRKAQVLAGLKSMWRDAPVGIRAAAAPCSGDCTIERSELAALLSAMIEDGP